MNTENVTSSTTETSHDRTLPCQPVSIAVDGVGERFNWADEEAELNRVLFGVANVHPENKFVQRFSNRTIHWKEFSHIRYEFKRMARKLDSGELTNPWPQRDVTVSEVASISERVAKRFKRGGHEFLQENESNEASKFSERVGAEILVCSQNQMRHLLSRGAKLLAHMRPSRSQQ